MNTKRREVRIENPYDFYYKMEAEERDSLLDAVLVQNRDYKKGRQRVPNRCLYFPISLNAKGRSENYGRSPGLVYLMPWSRQGSKSKGTVAEPATKVRSRYSYFKVYSFSPDDLDVDLEWWGKPKSAWKKLLTFLLLDRPAPTDYTTYFQRLQQEVEGGKLYYNCELIV